MAVNNVRIQFSFVKGNTVYFQISLQALSCWKRAEPSHLTGIFCFPEEYAKAPEILSLSITGTHCFRLEAKLTCGITHTVFFLMSIAALVKCPSANQKPGQSRLKAAQPRNISVTPAEQQWARHRLSSTIQGSIVFRLAAMCVCWVSHSV